MSDPKKLLIDTNILVDYLRGRNNAIKYLEKIFNSSVCYLSTVTVAELYAGVRVGREQRELEKFISAFEILPVDMEISIAGGLYKRDYGKSHGVGLADAMIAATADIHQAKLITLNIKHYPMIKNLSVPYV